MSGEDPGSYGAKSQGPINGNLRTKFGEISRLWLVSTQDHGIMRLSIRSGEGSRLFL